ncbi:hypothetical protein Pyn_36577 [Prunus yedoensis var. nudiflora]|uniref:60S ribosomal protein L6 n=1 Tax=Prunus yedoensis var. nudiflora TaxID=2094558 RepID=A0A314YQM5_PRUYE|nr:hypothetical protein Pyn_36577 [Prunus yedoensis var. nudiflora]
MAAFFPAMTRSQRAETRGWKRPPSSTLPMTSRSRSSTSASSGLVLPPGRELIILAGRLKGKSVVFLKQLSIWVASRAFKINGVPLIRVNQSYVIATCTEIDISRVNVEKFDDKYFAKQVGKKK